MNEDDYILEMKDRNERMEMQQLEALEQAKLERTEDIRGQIIKAWKNGDLRHGNFENCINQIFDPFNK